MITRTNAHTHSLNVVPGQGLVCLFITCTHTHTLVPQEGCRGYTHILTQCSLSSGNSERGARGRLISYSHTHSPFPGEPSQVRDFSVCSSHAHTHTYSGTPRGVPGIHTHTHSLNVVCPLVTPRGVPGEGLSLTHTHTVRFLVNHPRSGTSLSVHHMHTHTHTLVPQEGCRGYTHTHSLTQCSLSSGNSERGARGRRISYSHTHSPFPGEPSQVRDFSVCSSHAHTHTYSGTPRGVPGIHTHTHSLNVVCPLVTPRGVPGEGLSLTHTQSVSW